MNPSLKMDAATFLAKAEKFDPADRALFAALVFHGRQLSGRTLYDLGQQLRTGAGTISRWEHGHASPPATARAAIVQQLRELVANGGEREDERPRRSRT